MTPVGQFGLTPKRENSSIGASNPSAGAETSISPMQGREPGGARVVSRPEMENCGQASIREGQGLFVCLRCYCRHQYQSMYVHIIHYQLVEDRARGDCFLTQTEDQHVSVVSRAHDKVLGHDRASNQRDFSTVSPKNGEVRVEHLELDAGNCAKQVEAKGKLACVGTSPCGYRLRHLLFLPLLVGNLGSYLRRSI